MAQGDIIVFDQALVDLAEALHDCETGSFRLGLITGAVTPAATDSDPRFGSGGGTNYATNECAAGGNYSAGGPTLANPTVTLTGGLAMFDADDLTIAQSAGNPTNARWGICYNTATGNRALFAVDLGSTFDMTTGPLQFIWNANGIFRINN